MNEDRLISIEIKIAYQEDTIQQLNDVVCKQQKQINQLEKTCQLLSERVKRISEAADGGNQLSDEKPPHY